MTVADKPVATDKVNTMMQIQHLVDAEAIVENVTIIQI